MLLAFGTLTTRNDPTTGGQHNCATTRTRLVSNPDLTIFAGGVALYLGCRGADEASMSRTEWAQCGAAIIAADWAEWVSERCVRNVWCCEDCGYEFETRAYLVGPLSNAKGELAELVHRPALAA